MKVAARINHISISATRLTESVRFYVETFGAELIATPNFGFPVQWLQIADLQLHLFELPGDVPKYHHLALEVDDFEAVFESTRARGLHDPETMGYHLNELPSGQVQLYIRDPGGNLVEINWPNAGALSVNLRRQMVRLQDREPQDESNQRATLDLSLASHPLPR